jgi:hypothetical protein
MELDGEEIADLAVEVGDIGLRPADHGDLQVWLSGQMLGEDAQAGRFTGARRAGDEGEAALAGELGDPPAEECRRAVTCKAWTGTLGVKGFHLRP